VTGRRQIAAAGRDEGSICVRPTIRGDAYRVAHIGEIGGCGLRRVAA